MDDRAAKLTIVLGTNGTGKSTFLKKIVTNDLKKNPDSHILIVTPDTIEWPTVPFVHPKFPHRIANYVGVRKIIGHFPPKRERKEGQMNTAELINAYFRKGIVMFDDCRSYFANATTDDLHRMLIRRRQFGIDLFAIAHGFNDVPPVFFTFASDYILFKTNDNIRRRKAVISNYDYIEQRVQSINQTAAQPGKEHYFEWIKV